MECCRCVEGFAQRVLKKASTPLLQAPASPRLQTRVYDPSSGLPLRSARIAAQPLANVPVAKRGEALMARRLAQLEGTTVDEARLRYGTMFGDDPVDADAESMRELFPDLARPPRGRNGTRSFSAIGDP